MSRQRVLLVLICLCIVVPLVLQRRASAQHLPLRLSVNKWRVDPGDNYTLSWMESGSVQPMSDFVVEENADAQFKDKESYSRYVVRAHRKAFENSTAFSHTVRYYRVKARAWVRNDEEQQVEDEVVSNIVRVTLLGTDKAPAPAFADDPEDAPRKPKKDPKDGKKPEDEYPTMGRPDLVVQRIAIEPSPVAKQPFKVRVSIRNVGVVPSEPAQVKIEAAGRSYITECEGLRPNFAVDAVSPPITTDQAGPMQVTITVDPFDRIAESREDNNTKSTTMTVAEAPSKDKPPTSGDSKGSGNQGNGTNGGK